MRLTMRFLAFASLLALSACGTAMTAPGGVFGPPPVNHTLPTTGQIIYSCANGAQVAIVGGPSMVLAEQGQTGAYSNGRFTFTRGADASTASWATPGVAPVQCQGQ